MCRGGIVCWADIIGPKYIASRLNTWTKAYGDFFKPCAFLEERAASGVKLVFFSLSSGCDDILLLLGMILSGVINILNLLE
jgi:hypothetical protein